MLSQLHRRTIAGAVAGLRCDSAFGNSTACQQPKRIGSLCVAGSSSVRIRRVASGWCGTLSSRASRSWARATLAQRTGFSAFPMSAIVIPCCLNWQVQGHLEGSLAPHCNQSAQGLSMTLDCVRGNRLRGSRAEQERRRRMERAQELRGLQAAPQRAASRWHLHRCHFAFAAPSCSNVTFLSRFPRRGSQWLLFRDGLGGVRLAQGRIFGPVPRRRSRPLLLPGSTTPSFSRCCCCSLSCRVQDEKLQPLSLSAAGGSGGGDSLALSVLALTRAAADVAEGIAHLHLHGIIHRDIACVSTHTPALLSGFIHPVPSFLFDLCSATCC